MKQIAIVLVMASMAIASIAHAREALNRSLPILEVVDSRARQPVGCRTKTRCSDPAGHATCESRAVAI
jgi:hypothetical protein